MARDKAKKSLADTVSRFYSRVSKTANGCWLWTGGVSSNSYGQFWYNKRQVAVHRFAAFLNELPTPNSSKFHYNDNFHICHKCHNQLCVNPDHLYVGDHILNMQDRKEMGRYKTRENNPNGKLSQGDVDNILKKRASGASAKELSQEYDISETHVYRLCKQNSQ